MQVVTVTIADGEEYNDASFHHIGCLARCNGLVLQWDARTSTRHGKRRVLTFAGRDERVASFRHEYSNARLGFAPKVIRADYSEVKDDDAPDSPAARQ